jgi:hypothetical protein
MATTSYGWARATAAGDGQRIDRVDRRCVRWRRWRARSRDEEVRLRAVSCEGQGLVGEGTVA